MKIVISTTTGFHLSNLACELQKRGHEVTYFSYHPMFRIKKLGIDNGRSFFWQLFPFSLFALLKYFPKIQKKCIDLLFGRMDKLVAKNLPNCDVFIGLSCLTNNSAVVAKKKYGSKIIIERGSTHVLKQIDELKDTNPDAFSKNYIKRELISYSIADYISIPSLYSYDSFIEKKIDREKLFVNMYGVDTEIFNVDDTFSIASETIKIGFVGCWSYRKGCDLLIDFILNNPNLNIEVHHAGTIGDLDFPQDERFVTHGHVSKDELSKKIYCCCDIFVLPSREDGFGLVLLESLASGLPILASSNTGGRDISSIINNTDIIDIFSSEDTDDFEKKLMVKINLVKLNSRGDVRKLVAEKSQHFSWDSYGDRYNEFIKRL